ncbi:MAG: class I SAM-dependent methyltransferase, partial [Bdellovibrionales bacterium]|nr:class I SAM-dependent methyltransferase [Bdellovibrionales bacterium]
MHTELSYKVLDCGEFKKLEQVGDLKIVRPAASAIWHKKDPRLWQDIDWEFERNPKGQGKWHNYTKKEFSESIFNCGPLKMYLKPTPFGHMGLFAEQIPYWQKIIKMSKMQSHRPLKVLNLFAYTGGSSIAAALGGAEVVHVDASKTSVDWAKENAKINQLEDAAIRWLVDDVMVFVKREVRRGSKYDGIILDPPSYGRGPKNQLWKIEEDLPLLVENLQNLLVDNFEFLHLSAHT